MSWLVAVRRCRRPLLSRSSREPADRTSPVCGSRWYRPADPHDAARPPQHRAVITKSWLLDGRRWQSTAWRRGSFCPWARIWLGLRSRQDRCRRAEPMIRPLASWLPVHQPHLGAGAPADRGMVLRQLVFDVETRPALLSAAGRRAAADGPVDGAEALDGAEQALCPRRSATAVSSAKPAATRGRRRQVGDRRPQARAAGHIGGAQRVLPSTEACRRRRRRSACHPRRTESEGRTRCWQLARADERPPGVAVGKRDRNPRRGRRPAAAGRTKRRQALSMRRRRIGSSFPGNAALGKVEDPERRM